MTILVLTYILMIVIEILLVGISFAAIKKAFNLSTSFIFSLLLLFISFFILDNLITPLISVLDLTFSVNNKEIESFFNLNKNESASNYISIDLFNIGLYLFESVLALFVDRTITKRLNHSLQSIVQICIYLRITIFLSTLGKGLKNILIIILGFILGIILMIILRYNQQPLVEISIENQSGIKLTKIIIKDDELQNKYLIENLNTGDINSISLYCRGEIGYVVNAKFESGDTLTSGEIYAETGYNDYFVVQKDTIIQTKFGKY